MSKPNLQINESWETFRSKLYEKAKESDLRFGWLWREAKPIPDTGIEEMACAQIGKSVVIFQVWDQGFCVFTEDQEGDLDKLVNNLFEQGS